MHRESGMGAAACRARPTANDVATGAQSRHKAEHRRLCDDAAEAIIGPSPTADGPSRCESSARTGRTTRQRPPSGEEWTNVLLLACCTTKGETELAGLEEHILGCGSCSGRADKAQDYVDAMRIAAQELIDSY
jgi:hypothetical protein